MYPSRYCTLALFLAATVSALAAVWGLYKERS